MKRLFGLIFALVIAGAFLAYGISEEVPVGRVNGTVVMQENGRPIEDTLVTLTPIEEEKLAKPTRRFVTSDENGKFSLQNVVAGIYKLEASASEHHLSDKFVTVSEGKPTELELKMEPSERYLTLYTSQHVFTPDEKPNVEVHGFIQEDKLQIVVRKLSLDANAKRGGYESTLSMLARPQQNEEQIDPNSVSSLLSDQTVDIEEKDSEGAFIENLPLPQLSEGFYWVECRAGKEKSSAFLNISRIAMITKSDGEKAVSYVVDMASGKPIAGATLLATKGGRLVANGQTGADGLVDVTLPASSEAQVVAAKSGASVALCSMYSRSQASQGDDADAEEGGGDSTDSSGGRIFTYTDRPVYRPGDLVRFKTILRRLVGTEYQLPKPGMAKVELRDASQVLVASQSIPISAHGTIHGEFRTSKEADPGVYSLVVKGAGMTDRYWVNLAAYHKPDVKVTTHVEKNHYVMGDTVKVSVSCEYYFGGPVVGAKVSGYVYRSPDWSSYFDGDDELDNDTPYTPDSGGFQGGEYSVQVEAVTDAAGRATIEFPTTQKNTDDSPLMDYQYNVGLTVQDGSDRSSEANAVAHVSRGGFDLSVATDPLIAVKGDIVNVKIKATNYDEKHSPVAGRPVQLEVGEDRWTQHTSVYIPELKLNGITDQSGVATIRLSLLKARSLVLKASAEDQSARKVGAETYIYVEGSPSMRGPDESKFSLTLNQRKYALGDRCTALIETDKPGGVALLTLQSEHIIFTKTVPLNSASNVVHFSLPKAASPNAFVTVCYIREKEFQEATKQVVVKREDRQLSVEVKPDRPAAHPGDTVSFRVRTTDRSGRGVPAEVSVGVVDESVYAIKADTTDILSGLFPRLNNTVETEYSFPEVYLDGGDKAGGSVPIRTHFEDTASWDPNVETDRSGYGSVSLKLPDNLTTWRATAVAVTDASQAGMSTALIRSSKPIMVRVQSPPFMVKTDRQTISMVVTNDTGQDENVHFRVDAEGVTLDKKPPADFKLSVGQTESIPVDVSAPSSGPAVLTARVWTDDGAKDGVESKFTVEPHGRLTVDNQSGSFQDDAQFNVLRDPTTDPSAGRLAITLTPSVVSGMYQSLDGLVQFPYGCVEQTMSRFLPAVIVTRVMRDQGLPQSKLEKRVPPIIADGFARLATMQHGDGGWGWWTYDQSDAFMTAWVLDGLDRLKALGVEAPPNINVKSALDWAKKHLESNPKEAVDSKLYLIQVLARYGRFEEGGSGQKVLNTSLEKYPYDDPLRRWSLAALAAHYAGENGSIPIFLQHIDDEIDAGPKLSADVSDYQDERTALSLLALVTIAPNDPRIPQLANGLSQRRGTDGWESTRATTFAIEGLTAYIKQAKEGVAPIDFTVSLNGAQIKTIHADPLSEDPTDLRIEVPVSQLQVGKNSISIHRSGPGASFFASESRQYREQAVLGQVVDGSGITVERHYYQLVPQAMEDGSMKLMRTKKPVDTIKPGDFIQCVLTIRTPWVRDFLFIEDPIPSNCRVTDRVDPGDDNEWHWWWCDLTIFDDRVGIFARYLPKGNSVVTYTMRAEGTGLSHTLPTRVSNMYDPRQSAQSGETNLEVTR